MPFTSKLIGPVFFVRWIQVEPGDAKRLVELVKQAAELLRQPPVYVAVVPDTVHTPDDRGRQELTWALRHVLAISRCAHLVIEGSGFKKVMLRAAAAGMFLTAGQRGRGHVHDSVKAALAECDHVRGDASKYMRRYELGDFSEPPPAALSRK